MSTTISTKRMSKLCKLSDEHLKSVAEIENLCFSEPWSENSLKLLTAEGGVGFAVVCGDTVAAYGGMLCVPPEGQITNIATHPNHRRKGYARLVVNALTEYGRENGLGEIFLEVRRSNTSAIALYSSCDYVIIGERKRFYRNPSEDAVLMKIKILLQ